MPLRKVTHMNEADHLLVTQAVAVAEQTTDGEIVTIVTDLSDHYGDIAALWASAAAFLALAITAMFPEYFQGWLDWALGGWGHEFTAGEYLVMVFALMAIKWLVVWLAMQWIPLRMFFTPKPVKMRRVRERAIRLFKVSAEARTKGRTGILIFLSMGEHRAEIVADAAITDKVAPEIWGDAMLAMIQKVRAGQSGEGMAAAVAQVGALLTEYLPRSDENPNELPDRLIEI
jgi:putative membrane protein